LGLALRSLIETVACLHLINRRKLLGDAESMRQAYHQAEELSARLQAFRKTITPDQKWLREQPNGYSASPDDDQEGSPLT
jgi:hypothetical protein